ncbi:MAG: SoxR reducing system RseC family protein [Mediterranea sp.]|jgi:sigma-E factor negative regulatory protein RseC|nr:SoxR reducing system RseC family protein [Mediterranea sp.]
MAEIIEHQGIVESTCGSRVRVHIIQASACASCSVKANCSSADTKEKVVDAVTDDASRYRKGDSVIVYGALSMGTAAVVLAFVIPFCILIFSLFACMTLWNDELTAALVSLALLVPYYFVLWLSRSHMKRKFAFSVRPLREEPRDS